MSIADWKEREKEQRRSDIIEAALKLFASKGYENVSMDDIAEEIRLGKATLYRYFKSKESLFYAVVLRGVRIQHAMLAKTLKKASAGSEQLIAFGNTHYEFKRKYPEYEGINSYYYSGRFDLGNLMKDNGRETADSEAVKEISRLRVEDFDAMCAAITRGREDRTIRPGMDPVRLAILLSVFSNSLANLSPEIKCLLEYKGIDPDRFIDDARAFININVIDK